MTDLVERLRANPRRNIFDLCDEAADRIEELEAALTEIDNAPEPDHWVAEFQHVKDIAKAALGDTRMEK